MTACNSPVLPEQTGQGTPSQTITSTQFQLQFPFSDERQFDLATVLWIRSRPYLRVSVCQTRDKKQTSTRSWCLKSGIVSSLKLWSELNLCVCMFVELLQTLLSIQRIAGTNQVHQFLIKNAIKSPNVVFKPDNRLNSTKAHLMLHLVQKLGRHWPVHFLYLERRDI